MLENEINIYFKSPASPSSLFFRNFLQLVCVITRMTVQSCNINLKHLFPDGLHSSVRETDDGSPFIVLTWTYSCYSCLIQFVRNKAFS